ncbi:type II secretion system F family protein [Opitutales bacterium ASA1]|jgi:type IV pilus assembly protein PilC|uniref:type II secretion system F family protein n=1 Tax=Congregicoccus parvus TaxID=3081749 RepID=UPI002B281F38|nr:type II secretion system F family protein [Opitutales bacterium ASA1]
MAFLSTSPNTAAVGSKAVARNKGNVRSAQALAKQKSLEKRAKTYKLKLASLAVFTQQLASMLDAGLPLVAALEALQEQTEDPIFQIIIRDVRLDIASGTAFSAAVKKYPNAFNTLFTSMVEAGEASGGLAEILGKVAEYFEASVKLSKKVKSAMTYPVAVIGLAIILVNVLLIFVIPVFADMFADFGAALPAPTQFLIDFSNWMKSSILYLIVFGFLAYKGWARFVRTPKGRRVKDEMLVKAPIFGNLIRKITLSRFCRTYATLLRSGVPILRTLEIVASSSNKVQIESACEEISRHISSGGQVSDILGQNKFFPSMMRHMAKAGESTGNVDGMMLKIADFYDTESDSIIASLTSLIEPLLIVFLGVVVGGIVMAMFLPIFQLSSVAGGVN